MVTTMQTTWSPATHADYDALKGRAVVSADGEALGSIEAIFHPPDPMPQARGGHYFLVKPGALKNWFGGDEEIYVPETAITFVTTEGVALGYSKDQIEAQGWNRKPTGFDRFNRA